MLKLELSDYDLSYKCTAKCDDVYIQCVSNCSSSECVMECGRAMNQCSDGEFLFQQIDFSVFCRRSFVIIVYSACPCHTDCIEGCQGCENPICYCNVSLWLRNIHDNMFAHHLRTVPMTITWMLVWIRPAKLWANAFWTVKKTAAAKQVVYQILKSNILNAPVRFVQLNSFSKPYSPWFNHIV